MSRSRTVKYPPKRGNISKCQIEHAVKSVIEARGVIVELKRDIYKYHLKRGDEIIYSGFTNDLERREKELQREKR